MAIKGFEGTEIWPPNNNVFDDDDFLPSMITDIVLIDKHTNSELPNSQNTDVLNQIQCS